ncbi:MAG: DUF4230 domain-containing protein [Bacteroidota bacterium]
MKILKNILLIILVLVLIGVVWYAGYKFSWTSKKQETSINVVLEKVEKVFKLVTVEGHFAEIYNFKETNRWELPFFTKKALLRVNAKVLAGYDFEKVKITTDEASKSIIIENFPEAEILSLEHDLDYYDISQGTFNKFTSDDYNRMHKEAKEFIRYKAEESSLFQSADEQKDQILDMLKTLIEANGWEVIVQEENQLLAD